MRRPFRSLWLMLVVGGLLGASVFTATAVASTTGTCDLYASPSGSDHGTGQLASPLQTVAALDYALAPGQTGCLEAGTYGGISTTSYLGNNGTSTGQITITAAPGQTATVVGLVELEGSYTTLSGLNIDGSNDLYDAERSGTTCPYPVSNGFEIDGHDDIFQDNNLYQSVASLRGNGIGIGWNSPADNTIIRDNRIHDLGQCEAFDQMIYLAHGTGVQIYDNWLWNDPHGWGVQIYPGAADAHVYDNVIDAAGSGIVIGGSTAVANNTVDHNIILNSTGLPNAGLTQGVGISTCCGLGAGNSFTDNDVYNNPGGIANATGITLANNTTTNPALADPAAHDYRPTGATAATGALTAGWSLWDGGLGSVTTTSTGTTTTSTGTGTTSTGTASAPAPVSTAPPAPAPEPAPVTTPPTATPPAAGASPPASSTAPRPTAPSTSPSKPSTKAKKSAKSKKPAARRAPRAKKRTKSAPLARAAAKTAARKKGRHRPARRRSHPRRKHPRRTS